MSDALRALLSEYVRNEIGSTQDTPLSEATLDRIVSDLMGLVRVYVKPRSILGQLSPEQRKALFETASDVEEEGCGDPRALERGANKDMVLVTVSDLVSDLLYYDRKEDRELPRGAIEAMIKRGELTVDEIVARFRSELEDGLR